MGSKKIQGQVEEAKTIEISLLPVQLSLANWPVANIDPDTCEGKFKNMTID